MNISQLPLENIYLALQNPLPGYPAQAKMQHLARKEAMENLPAIPDDHKKAAVMCLFYPHNGEWTLVFIQRPDYDGAHSGQIAFAGGGVEPSDRNTAETALRETYEEIGVLPETIEILGSLSELYIPVSNFLVYPYIGYTPARPEFLLDPVEVAGIIELPLQHFFEPERQSFGDIHIGIHNYLLKDVPFYIVEDKKLWGATAMMLSEFVAILTSFTSIQK